MIRSKKTIIFPLEISSRELIPKCLLSLKAIEKGYRVYIGSPSSIDLLKGEISSCIFFHKSTWEEKVLNYKKRLGAVFVILDEEAGIAIPRSNISKFCSYRYKTVTKKKYDHIITIGKTYKSTIENLRNTNNVEVHDCGWPRIDLWREEFKPIYNGKVNQIYNKYGSYYLFISSFGVTSEETFEQRLSTARTDYQKTIRIHRFEHLKKYLNLLKELSSQLKIEEKIIVRPHPSEHMNDWLEFFSDYSNIEVIREGDVTPWLLASSALISFGSTVNIQAALQGIPTVQFDIRKKKGITDTPIFEVPKQLDNAGEILEYLRTYKNCVNKEIKLEAKKLIKNDISSLEGELASEKIIRVLNSNYVVPQDPVSLSFIKKLKYKMKINLGRTKYLFFKKIGVKGYQAMPNSLNKRPNGIKKEEVLSILHKLSEVQNFDTNNIYCKQIAEDLVSIELI